MEIGVISCELIYPYKCWQCLPLPMVFNRCGSESKGAGTSKVALVLFMGDDDRRPVQYSTNALCPGREGTYESVTHGSSTQERPRLINV